MCCLRSICLSAIILQTHWLVLIRSDRKLGVSKVCGFQVCLTPLPVHPWGSWLHAHGGGWCWQRPAGWPPCLWLRRHPVWALAIPAEAAEDAEGSWGYCRGGGRDGCRAGELYCSCKTSVFISPAAKIWSDPSLSLGETVLIMWDRGVHCLFLHCPSRGCSFCTNNLLFSMVTPGTC